MRFVENRRIAKIVLAVCIVSSIFFLGGGGLYAGRQEVLNVFDEGTDTTLSARHSMDAYLDACAEKAEVLASEAAVHMASSETAAAVLDGAKALAAAETISERYAAYIPLKSSVEALYSEVGALSVSAQQMATMKIAYYDFKGAVNKIDNDQYSTIARGFNKKISAFPANIIASLLGVELVDTFGG